MDGVTLRLKEQSGVLVSVDRRLQFACEHWRAQPHKKVIAQVNVFGEVTSLFEASHGNETH